MDAQTVARMQRPKAMPFRCNKIGHVALYVKDPARSARFYTEVMGFSVSDAYDSSMLPGGVVFLRCAADHHGVALFKLPDGQPAHGAFHHMAFEVSTLDEVLRAREHLRRHDVPIHFEGRRRAGCQLAIEFQDPDGHNLEIYWDIDQVGSDGRVRPPSRVLLSAYRTRHRLCVQVDRPVSASLTNDRFDRCVFAAGRCFSADSVAQARALRA